MVSSAPIGDFEELSAQLVVELPVRSLAESISFYRAVGFRLVRATPSFAALCWGDRYLFLTERTGAVVGETAVNLRVIVGDVDAVFDQATAKGWPIRYAVADRGYGLRDFTVLDPDGYELRFAAIV